jgi:hypothetical protein
MEVLTSTGFQHFDGVLVSESKSVITCYFENTHIKCTEDHIFFTNSGEVQAKKLTSEHIVNGHRFVRREVAEDATVYDLVNVKGGHEYITNDLSSHNCVYMDELAFIPRRLQQKFFTSVYPTITSGETTKLIITSTPNGLDLFYKLWDDSQKGKNNFVRIDINWWDTPGRDEDWYQAQVKNLGERQCRQEYNTDFLGSNHTLIEGEYLTKLQYLDPIFQTGDTKVFKKPEMDHVYFAMVDSSGGVGGDYSTVSIIDATKMPYEVVCTFRNNYISSMVLPEIVSRMCIEYNNAWVLVETNNMGQETVNLLHNEYEYENIIQTAKAKGKKELDAFEGKNLQLGVFTDKRIKRIGCSTLKSLIENNQLIVNDVDIISELASFVKKGSSYQAEEGEHDDLVMNLVLFSWFTKQEFFKDVTNTEVWKTIQERRKQEMEDFAGISAFFDDGTNIIEDDQIQEINPYEFNRLFGSSF